VSDIETGEGGRGAVSSIELFRRARRGNAEALDQLMRAYLPRLFRWAHGRLPRAARHGQSTGDIVQDAILRSLRNLDEFDPRHEAALESYLRQAIRNRIRDEIRKIGRQPRMTELNEEAETLDPSPLAEALSAEAWERYEVGLERLRPQDREAILLRVEMGLAYEEVARALGKPSIEAARLAVKRALGRLMLELGA
jgi:RNA polymerase sigma-70 factor (ECF subfamily)